VGGSSKKVTVGYKYYLGMHMIWCHGPVDKLLRIRVDKRDAWVGNHLGGPLAINAEGLFGGKSREGGVSGLVDLEMGLPTQPRNSYLQSQLGSVIPAFRGVVGMVLRRCYLGTNPYLKKWDARFQRIHVRQDGLDQWYDSKAAIASYGEIIGAGYLYWRYQVVDLSDPSDYSSPSFNDTGWPVGPSPFGDKPWSGSGTGQPAGWGFSNNPSTVVPQQKKVWLRTTIRLSELPTGGFLFDSFVDNGIEVWINGNKVITNYDQFGHYYLTTIPSSYFVVGENKIAVCGRDDNLGVRPENWFYFDLRLRNQERTILDMNPAHIIRECLTDPDWGMGYAEADIDDDSFRAAADVLYDEKMGISILWDRQVPIESFIQEVVKHINAALYVSRSTGKFVLKLIRADYDEEALPEFDPSNVEKVDNPSRPAFGELTNSVTVNYWNSETGKETSLTVQDTALIQMQGAVINTTVEYPGFTNFSIASRVALRDLRTLSSPLLTCTIYTNQDARELNIGDVFKFSWPDFEIENVVMRVTGIAFGDGKSNKIRVTCTQDVFAFPQQGVLNQPDEGWTDIGGPPAPATDRLVLEAPYYELVQAQGQTAVDGALASTPEIGYLIVAAARPANALNASVWVDPGSGFEEATALDFCPTATLAADVGPMDTSWTFENGEDLDLVQVGTHCQIDDELVRVDSIDLGTSTITVGRGVLDTTPRPHLTGARLYFWDLYSSADPTEYVDGETLDVKITPATNEGPLELGGAPVDTLTFNARAFRPYPPGNFKINGVAYPASTTGTDVVFSWSHRDRRQQTSGSLFDTTYGDIGPEAGTTYNLRVYDDSGILIEDQTGLTGTSYIWPNPSPIGGTEFEPCDLSFSKVVDSDYLEVAPAGLVAHTETYTSDSGQVSHYTANTPGTVAITGGKLQVSYANDATDKTNIDAINTQSFTAPLAWVGGELAVSGTATSYSNAGVGIAKDGNNYVMAVARKTSNQVLIEARIGGGSAQFLGVVSRTIPSSFKLGLAMVGNSATVWMDSGSGWEYVTGASLSSLYDFQTVGNMAGWMPSTFAASRGGAVTWTFDNLANGIHGGVGIRDQTIVTNEDGTPYRPTPDTILFSATLPDARGAAYAGMFELDLTDYSYQQVGAIMVERDGKVHADLGPHVIYYPNGDMRILIGTWGNGFGNSIQVLHKLETSQELLSGVRIVSGMTQLALPQSGANPGAYDPMMVWDSVNSRWLIAYSMVQNTNFSGHPFYAAAAYSTDLTTWTSLGVDTELGYEGTKILYANSQYWILAGGPAGTGNSSRVFDASMVYQGTLNAVFEGGTSTQPHPMIFPYGDKQVMISFDDVKHGSANFTWGNFLVYEASRFAPETASYRVELESQRDGVVSYQKHNWTFQLGY
jgi:hypothetical protein